MNDNGGAAIKQFVINFRRQFGEWNDVAVERRSSTFMLEELECGTFYEISMFGVNQIGTGSTSNSVSIKTLGDKPIAPKLNKILKVNYTSAVLDLVHWQNGGCPISHFSVEYMKNDYHSNWIVASSKITSLTRFLINDLELSTTYTIRMQAFNNAGHTTVEYSFETLSVDGGKILFDHKIHIKNQNMTMKIFFH